MQSSIHLHTSLHSIQHGFSWVGLLALPRISLRDKSVESTDDDEEQSREGNDERYKSEEKMDLLLWISDILHLPLSFLHVSKVRACWFGGNHTLLQCIMHSSSKSKHLKIKYFYACSCVLNKLNHPMMQCIIRFNPWPVKNKRI